MSPAASTSSSTDADGSEEASTGRPAARAAAIALALLPVSSSTLRAGADEGDARRRARGGQLRVLGEEAVARIDRIGPGLRGHPDDLVDRQVGPDRMSDLADLVGLVGLQPVQGIAVLIRVDRDRRDAHLEGGAERADGDLPAVGDEDFGDPTGHGSL